MELLVRPGGFMITEIIVGQIYVLTNDKSDPVQVISYMDNIVEFVYLKNIAGISHQKRKHTDKLFSRVYKKCTTGNILFSRKE